MPVKRSAIVDVILYVVALAAVAAVKLFYSGAEVHELVFILKPVTGIVELFLGVPFYFSPEEGFRNSSLAVVIGKSCAGLNYYIILSCMLVFSFIGRIKNRKHKFAAFILFFASSYVVTVGVNSFRIITAISFMQLYSMDREQAHRFIGVLFYLFSLIACYCAAKKIFVRAGVENETVS